MATKKYITVLAVVEVCEQVYVRSNEQLLQDVGRLFGNGWPIGCVGSNFREGDGAPEERLIANLSFASVEHGVSNAARSQGCDAAKSLSCDFRGCGDPVTHVDHRGFVYCAKHAAVRKAGGERCRILKAAEIRKLEASQPIRY